ncbi:hypothetical protein EVAR_102533_1 [Eumeta japonica]|uniref:Uncharacterized protein n=1 Tax=Eumeta variegata TaxID=151549 RepID=A0A4C1SWL6_EUMVA|nr:hypothetical protein EVAR_102533_1 [Eumeta japonica]
MQHLDVLLSGYRGLGEPRSGNGVPNLQRREGLWLCPRVIPKEKLCQPWLVPIRLQHGGSSGAVAYQQTVLEIPGRVVVKLRHDAHLSASSHLLGMPGL